MKQSAIQTITTDILDDQGIWYRILRHAKPVFTALDAAHERSVELSQVTKAMIVKTADERFLCVLIPGNRKLEITLLTKGLGTELALAPSDEIEHATGYPLGAISPFGLRECGVQILVDKSVLDHEKVTISSGTPEAGLLLRSEDLVSGLNAQLGIFSEMND